MSEKHVEVKVIGGTADSWAQAVTTAAEQIEKYIDPDCFLLFAKDNKAQPAIAISANPVDTIYLMVRAIETIAAQNNFKPAEVLEHIKDAMDAVNNPKPENQTFH